MDKDTKTINGAPKEIEWCGWLNEFFWICSGVNRKVLRQCPNDYSKYFGIGGTIFFTAMMAMLSGGYALYTVFKDPKLDVNVTDNDAVWKGIIFGIFWGLLILNLDRFMVNTMYSDGKHTISTEEIKGGLPRIILAIFLGIVISTPIELRIFEDKIETQLKIDAGIDGKNIDDANQDLMNRITAKENEIAGYEKQKDNINEKINQAQRAVDEEINGTGGTRQKGIGIRTKQKMEIVKQLESEREIQFQQINNSQKKASDQLDQLNKDYEDYTIARKKAVEASKGLSARLKALSEVTSASNNFTLFMARILVMLLFVAIEVIPTIFRMMMEAGPYDHYLEAENHKWKIDSMKRISALNDEANTELEISTQKNESRLKAETEANETLLKQMADAQAEMIKVAIDAWREQELIKIKENPYKYVQFESDPYGNPEENNELEHPANTITKIEPAKPADTDAGTDEKADGNEQPETGDDNSKDVPTNEA
jgi:hypothetical protein